MRGRAALVALTALVASVSAAAPASAVVTHALIQGTGSAWAANAVNQWIASVQMDGLQVVYTANGSTAGQQDFADDTTDFAVTDLPLGESDPTNGREYGEIPIAAGATTFPYHLVSHGKRVRDLRLSGKTVAKIFTGQITNWDDPAITADNNGRRLPAIPITPVVLSNASGVTYEFTTYLADRYPKIWQAFAGTSKPTEIYPRAGNEIAENGSDGLMNYVSSAAAEGAIGVVEYAYALGSNYPVANLENKAGYFVPPSQYDVSIALRSATIDENPADADYMQPDLKPVFTAPDRRAYPLSSYASMVIPTSATDSMMSTAKRQTLADFGYYGMCQGQDNIGAIGYAPLPLNLVQAGFTQIARLQAADSGVVLTDESVSHCMNPTFLDSHPARNYLGSIAPEPPACDKSGQGPCGVRTIARLRASTLTVAAGHVVVFHGRLVDRPDSGGPPHALVHLQRRRPHHGWKTVAAIETTAAGTVTVRLTPASTARYRLVDAEPGSGHPISPVVRVIVTPGPG
jgi:phosphate transport system substrate-binding protein